nr:SDR family oxidoreductase [Sphingomonas sp. Y57]
MSNAGAMFDLADTRAIVTGGASGLGRAIAVSLARSGAAVAIADRDQAGGAETLSMIAALGQRSALIDCDISREQQVDMMIGQAVTKLGGIDLLVNGAGVYRHATDEEQSREDWDTVLGINLTGTWLCTRAAMRQMRRQGKVGGKIINIASIAAVTACSNGSYDASKAAIVHLSRVLAARWGRYNINVNCISPGYVAAGMNGTERPEEERALLRSLTPLGHVLRPIDLVGPVHFLASRAADYVTGQNIVVDGGHTLGTWLAPFDRDLPPRVGPVEECDP